MPPVDTKGVSELLISAMLAKRIGIICVTILSFWGINAGLPPTRIKILLFDASARGMILTILPAATAA